MRKRQKNERGEEEEKKEEIKKEGRKEGKEESKLYTSKRDLEYLQTQMIVVLTALTCLILKALVFPNHRKSSFNDLIKILGNVIFKTCL